MTREKVLQEILTIDDWRHPFELDNGDIVPMKRTEIKPWNKWRADLSNKGLRQVMDLTDRTVLDIACNDGYFSFQLGNTVKKRIGIDCRAQALHKANLMKQYYGEDSIEFIEGDIRTFDFNRLPDCPFDLMLCYGILCHLTDPFSFLQSIFPLVNHMLSLSTFINWQNTPSLTITKEEVELDGSGLETISLRPSHQAVVRLLYGVGFDLVLRYIPARHPYFGFYKWGHYFGVKLNGLTRDDYLQQYNVLTRFNRFKRSDQLVLCRDTYDTKAIKLVTKPERYGNYYMQRFRRKVRHFFGKFI